MDRPLSQHISYLEQRLWELHFQVMENARTQAERNQIEAEIRAALMALDYYRKALELEMQLTRGKA